jgi:acyl dehydratase
MSRGTSNGSGAATGPGPGERPATKMERQYFEDCRVGDHLRTGGRTITETDVVMFAALSGDWNPVHTDAQFASRSAFGERIAHGLLTLVAGVNLLFRHGGFGNGLLPSALIALTGVDRVRFVAPVRIGDTVRLDCELVEMRRVFEQQGTLTLRFRVLNQRDEETVTGRLTMLVECRQPGPRSRRAPTDEPTGQAVG